MAKNILILRDSRTGNFRQAQAVANIAVSRLKERDIDARVEVQEIRFKNKFSKIAFMVYSGLASGWRKGYRWSLRLSLTAEVYRELLARKPDLIITGGASVAPVNVLFSRESGARSVAVMKPALADLNKFDLVIMPKHDLPPQKENILATEGALNLIDGEYLEKQAKALLTSSFIKEIPSPRSIGFLIGGDAKGFHLKKKTVSEVIRQIKSGSEAMDADILVSTSRRTSGELEELVKKEFQGHGRCKLLVIANENNIPEAVGAILGLCRFVVISPESIMMISEAVNSRKYVLAFQEEGLSRKHASFLDNFAKNKYIYLTPPSGLGRVIREIDSDNPRVFTPAKDEVMISRALDRIL